MENQNKTVIKTLKIPQETAEKLETEAGMRGMDFNEYVLDSALHQACRLTPEILCKMENILQRCMQSVDNPKIQKWVRKEMTELWGCLR
ncbi:MAG: hypothetical protein IJ265_02295 [Oscillospiraceae bacterium]|nr:hypothetical protein [Oscillospiraceae bacterium]